MMTPPPPPAPRLSNLYNAMPSACDATKRRSVQGTFSLALPALIATKSFLPSSYDSEVTAHKDGDKEELQPVTKHLIVGFCLPFSFMFIDRESQGRMRAQNGMGGVGNGGGKR
ncbi:hypothetical protein INR49_017187 [Caranx melampygus]|nr:hypothetical protein INR49_017187 [Caranx melampygus]